MFLTEAFATDGVKKDNAKAKRKHPKILDTCFFTRKSSLKNKIYLYILPYFIIYVIKKDKEMHKNTFVIYLTRKFIGIVYCIQSKFCYNVIELEITN